jgi:outer membrane protein OmpA-like peptidoglycan-associated protein
MKAFGILSTLTLFFLLGNFSSTAQGNVFGLPSEWGTHSLLLSAENSSKSAFAQYENLSDLGMTNCAWLTLVAPHDGTLTISAPANKLPYEIVLFRAETPVFNQELNSGNAFLLGAQKIDIGKELIINENSKKQGIDGSLFQVLKGQSILIYLNSSEEGTVNLTSDLKKSNNLEARNLVVPFEFRKNTASKTMRIVVRDGITGLPLKARINIQGLKGIDNIYNGSDFIFDLVNAKSASIVCDAPGYFSNEVTLKTTPGVDNVITIKLMSFSSALNMRLDGVQFKEGSADPLPSAYPDLDKLVDFMNANPSINIEIQGHVNAPNSQSKAAQKLSERRAKFVYDYLVSKGVQAKRMTYVGYGNTAMIYQNPKNQDEERANRRVEIKIIE